MISQKPLFSDFNYLLLNIFIKASYFRGLPRPLLILFILEFLKFLNLINTYNNK